MKELKKRIPVLLLMTGVLAICSLMTGCIKEDLSGCDIVGNYGLKIVFTNQTVVDKFESEVTRLDFFIFDGNGLLYERVTDAAGPFKNGYTRTFLSLPFGKYQLVVWANLYDDKYLEGELREGITRIEDLKLKLVTTQTRVDTQPGAGYPVLENFVKPMPEKLLWGTTGVIEINTGQGLSHTVDLTKDSKDIHFIFRWKNYEGFYDYSTEHQRTTRAYVVGSGDLNFANQPIRERNVSYLPFYRDPSAEDPWWGQTGGSYIPPQLIVKEHVSVLPDFRLMRLTADGSTEKLVVTTILSDGTEKIVYTRSIVDLIRLTGHYNSQQQMDQTNDYLITIDFRCVDENHQHGSTWIALTIWVNGWVVKEIDSEI